jgi:transcriptional regulator with XRE-family HTH domain
MDTGTRLKLVRESYKLSQRELARRSGVTNATISLIEQNRVSPSVSSLKKLLESIPMSLADFFTFDQPPREDRYVFRANEQPDLGRHGVRLLLVGAVVPSRQMRFLREQYAPGASSGDEPIMHAEGEECGLVTRGTVELTIDGQVSVLNAGDGYYFPTTLREHPRELLIASAQRVSLDGIYRCGPD